MHPVSTLSAAKEVLKDLHSNTLSPNDKALLADLFAAYVGDEYLAAVLTDEEHTLDDYLHAQSGVLEQELQAYYRSL